MAKASLFAKPETPPNLPAIPSGGGFAAVDTSEQQKDYAPYVIFARKEKLAELKGEGLPLSDGDAVLIGDGDPRKISPLTFFMLDVFHFSCVKGGEDDGYRPVRVWEGKLKDAEGNGVKNFDGDRVSEVVAAAIWVLDNGRLVPATCRFQDAMAVGMIEAIRVAKEDAASPDWAKLSPDHAATMSIPVSNGRFKVELSWRPQKNRTSGNTYFKSKARIIPTSAGDSQAVGLLMSGEGKEATDAALAAFREYREEMLSLVA